MRRAHERPAFEAGLVYWGRIVSLVLILAACNLGRVCAQSPASTPTTDQPHLTVLTPGSLLMPGNVPPFAMSPNPFGALPTPPTRPDGMQIPERVVNPLTSDPPSVKKRLP